jgi:hypothetical protein
MNAGIGDRPIKALTPMPIGSASIRRIDPDQRVPFGAM